jgi:hypothetical protein
MDEEKKVEETTEGQPETAQEEVRAEEVKEIDPAAREIAKKLVAELPEHTTIQRVDNGFVISIPGQKHRVAYTLEEVIKHVTDIFTA